MSQFTITITEQDNGSVLAGATAIPATIERAKFVIDGLDVNAVIRFITTPKRKRRNKAEMAAAKTTK